jgi:hypothetical protein
MDAPEATAIYCSRLKTLEVPVKSRQSFHLIGRGQSYKGGSSFTVYFRPSPPIESRVQYSSYAHL